MIYTCTLNPSIDYVMNVDEFKPGDLNRASQTFYYPGGKGINVSRVMARLGVKTIALGFTGGFTGEFVKDFLNNEEINHQFIDTEQNTRVNVKLKSQQESEINGPGPILSSKHQEELMEQVRTLTNEDTLILAGSVPSSLPEDFYITIADVCSKNGTKLAVDTSGKALKQLIGRPIYLLKPNHHELGELFNVSIDSMEKAAHYGKKLADQGVQHVIVSMGGDGAVYIGPDQQLYSNVPKGQLKNSVGAGDSVVSGFVASMAQGKSTDEAFRVGVASGSATAFQDDLCTAEDVEKLLGEVKISSLSIGGKPNENHRIID